MDGGWQTEVNEFGGVHRFRFDGRVKEYEPTVIIDGIEIPQSQIGEFNRRRKEQTAARIAESNGLKPCTFDAQKQCSRAKCALFDGNGCGCPLTKRPCSNECGLYKNGCVLIATIRKEYNT